MCACRRISHTTHYTYYTLTCVVCRWDEPKFPLRRPIKETIEKISEIMGHIEDDLKVWVGVCCVGGGGGVCVFVR